MDCWTKTEDHGAAAAVNEKPPGVPTRRVKVTLKHPLSKQTYTALLDTGTASLVAKEVVSWYTPKGKGMMYHNVNGELQETMGSIQLFFVLPEFSDKRECSQDCKMVDKLLYPLILGNDVLQQQGMEIDYREKMRWNGLTLAMDTRSELKVRVAFAVSNEDDRTLEILDVTGKKVYLDALIPKEHLSAEQRARLPEMLRGFKILSLQTIGKLRRKPPVKPGSRPCAYKPYPVPLIHRRAIMQEVERLERLDVLEPDKDSPWAAPCFVIPKKDGTVRFLTDFRGLNKCLERLYYPLNNTQALNSGATATSVRDSLGSSHGVLQSGTRRRKPPLHGGCPTVGKAAVLSTPNEC
ncbi:hypothetical protein PI124_g23561 [Phytophthora idaei]|nr:hypothetical protein PI125_g20776 [Phytophthora idaei]KAG3231344.1 hypothetical protein PI124_g23561 [Phytophthora idaei]